MNNQRPLPAGWRWVRIGEICEVSTGGTPATGRPEFYGGNIPWLKSGDIKGTWIHEVPNRISELGLANSNARLHPTESVMLAMSGQGKTRGTSAILRVPSACSQSVAAILPSNEAIPEIIHFTLVSQYENIRRLTGDNERTGLNLKLVRNIMFALPPPEEQKRIAAILNEQMGAVERARAAAEAQLEAAKALPAAYLRAVFSSPEALKWQRKKVSELCERIDYGYTASGDFAVETPRFLRITDIQDGRVNWETVPGCHISAAEEGANRLNDGDIVFARTGATTGKSFLIRQPPRAVFASYLIRLRPKHQLLTEYMYVFFQSDGYWQQIRANARGGAQPNVNATMLGAIVVPMPPSGDQERIAAILNEQMASAERARKAIEEELDTINKLPAALLRRAFSGEL